MKKILFFLVFFVMPFFSLALYAQTGIIREITGTVEVKAPGSLTFSPARVGDRVSQHAVVSTGFRSSALIEIGSCLISVRALSRLSLDEIFYLGAEEYLHIDLQAGRIRADVNPPAGMRVSMDVTSPHATASIRGTSFWFDGYNLGVISGTVLYKGNRGQEVTIPAGNVISLLYDGRAGEFGYRGLGSGAEGETQGASALTPPQPVGLDMSSRAFSKGPRY
ncbi:MAG: FecR family protein [Treponema sp.]|nr:FecR family protein [Treponema sp.]